jgi:protein-tyrosine-phosphatase
MAAALLRERLAALGLDQEIEVHSAGVYAEAGVRASRLAVSTLAGKGVPLNGHRSQPLVPALLNEADLVLVMEESHRRSIFYLAPQYLGKVYLLSELSGGHADVADPFGGSAEDYARTVALLERLIDTGLPRLLRLLKLPYARDTGIKPAAPEML